MKLPNDKDSGGEKEGAIPRKYVLETLFRHKISVVHGDPEPFEGSGGFETIRLESDDEVMVVELPDPVPRSICSNIARHFGFSPTEFLETIRQGIH